MENIRIGKKTAYFRSYPKYIKVMLDVIDILYESFDIDVDKCDLLKPITSDNEDELLRMFKKHQKTKKKKDKKFVLKDMAGKEIKKPISGYNIWLKEQRIKNDKLKEYAKKTNQIIPKFSLSYLSNKWNELDKKTKGKYKKKAKDEIDKYNKLLEREKKAAIKAGEYEKPKPKKAKTAYIYFVNDPEIVKFYSEQGFVGLNINKEASKKWNIMSDEDKEPYYNKFREDKKRYEIEMEQYMREVEEIKERKNKCERKLAHTFKKEHENSKYITEFNFVCENCGTLNNIKIDTEKIIKESMHKNGELDESKKNSKEELDGDCSDNDDCSDEDNDDDESDEDDESE